MGEFDWGSELLSAGIAAVAEVAAEAGLGDVARGLLDLAERKNARDRKVFFEKAYQTAVKALGELTEDQKKLFDHRPFLEAVLVGLLDPASGLDLQAAFEDWVGDWAGQRDVLRRFFMLLKKTLASDAYWGGLLVRYQELREQPELDGKVDEAKILRELKVMGDGAVVIQDSNGNVIYSGDQRVYNVHTGGGASVEGDVNTGGGDFVGRDKIVHIHSEPQVATGEAELKAYFRALAAECGELPLGVIDTEFARREGISLEDVYIDLDVLAVDLKREKELGLLQRALEHPEKEAEEWRAALIEIIGRRGAGRMVLLGAAGSGKTTFVDYLTQRLAHAYAEGRADEGLPETLCGRLPVRLVLRKAAGQIPVGGRGTAKMLWDALEEDVRERLGGECPPAWERLQKEIRAGHSLILLDGLDEVAEAGERRVGLLQAVEAFLAGLKNQPVLLTARPYAYANPQWQLKGCAVFNLAPLSPEQVGRFVERWYSSVRHSIKLSEAEAQKRAGQLAEAIAARDYLGDLASRPLLLTQMAMVHSTDRELPEDRADLYEKTVDLLLKRWQKSGSSAADLGLDPASVRAALAELAYQTHTRQRGTQETEGPGDIPFGEMLASFAQRLPQASPAQLTAYLQHRAGVVVEREPGRHCFVHRSFQEYLAACHLLDTSKELSADLRRLVDEDAVWWREVILLAIGKVRQGSLVSALDLLRNALLGDELEQCPNPTAGDWQAAVLGGLGLAELRVRERQAELAELPRNLPRARKWLVGVMERSGLGARERLEAGDVLARLGDDRFDADQCYLPKGEMLGFVRIPGGVFQMGSDPKRDSNAQEREQPQHTVEVSEFYIQRYPVTVAQFGAFVGQSGYRPNNPRCLKGIANHPVVNVTWDDAVAYCKWLEGWLRENGPEGLRGRLAEGGRIRLPSEAEWEKAARGGDGRIYPWGDKFDADKTNTRESKIGGTSPVGSFPGDVSLYGVMDMSGNVWEWCEDWWDEKYYRVAPGRNPKGPDSGESKVIRGGSWGPGGRGARCASRPGFARDYFDLDLGFRVLSPGAF